MFSAARLLSTNVALGTRSHFYALQRCKSTINISKSLQHGALIPDLRIEDTGIFTTIGKRQAQEDRHLVKTLDDGSIVLAVFDGHGGSLAAEYTAKHMSSVLESNLANNLKISDALEKTFIEINSKLLEHIKKRKIEKERYSGTTATVCLIRDNIHLHTASAGDSRALLCRRSVAEPLTSDHHPDREDEKERIQKEGGGIVSNSLGQLLVNGRLAMTRSIGDFDLKSHGVTAKPDYSYHEIKPCDDSFVALFTDGIHFSLENQDVADIILSSDSTQSAAENVSEEALGLNSQDNNTVIVLPLGSWGRHPPLNKTTSKVGLFLPLRD
ncbi:protein phosphatase 1K, mitochondrial-like [Watersipora subatra]|uniref:protein phosphatase 1K, mitochondrial-like n=1 Tax=Watersipora subatra TaxID=2589382 RepID=UPI00355C560F